MINSDGMGIGFGVCSATTFCSSTSYKYSTMTYCPRTCCWAESQGMKIDESSLTDESDACKKKVFGDCENEYQKGTMHPPSNTLPSGTDVIEGNGKAIVLAVGKYSQKGKYYS